MANCGRSGVGSRVRQSEDDESRIKEVIEPQALGYVRCRTVRWWSGSYYEQGNLSPFGTVVAKLN